MLRLRRGAWLAIVAWSGVPPLAGAQTLPGEVARDQVVKDLQAYHGFIEGYRRGDARVVEQVLRWDRRRLHRVLSSVETARDDRRPWGAVRFKAAVMVHTDAALDLMSRPQAEAEAETALLHLDLASQLLKKGGRDVEDSVGSWYQAVAGRMRGQNWLTAAEAFLASGRDRWPQHPAILYESALLQELLAGDTSLPAVTTVTDVRHSTVKMAVPGTAPLTRAAVDEIRGHRQLRLGNAARWLQEAVAREPGNELAGLHLGRVQTLRNQHRAAADLLASASRSSNPAIAYLGLLFTAALHERQGHDTEAMQAYGGAMAKNPLNQAAAVGMSALLHRTGRGDDARAILQLGVDARRTSRRDPWWTYFYEPAAVALARFELFRREVRQ